MEIVPGELGAGETELSDMNERFAGVDEAETEGGRRSDCGNV